MKPLKNDSHAGRHTVKPEAPEKRTRVKTPPEKPAKSAPDRATRRSPERPVKKSTDSTPKSSLKPELSAQLEEVRSWLTGVRFKKSLFGVDEADVWRKIGELNSLYEAALAAERVRYDVLLQERVAQNANGIAQENEAYVPAPAETEKPDDEAE